MRFHQETAINSLLYIFPVLGRKPAELALAAIDISVGENVMIKLEVF